MKNLNNTTDVQKYLKFGNLTQPFLVDAYVLNKVMQDYNTKLKLKGQANKLESLYLWIHKNVVFSKDKDFKSKYKFQRTAEEIWQSKTMTGCTDYCILFVTFARQIGIPATMLCTAEQNWLFKLKNGEDCKLHCGHVFCECFYNGKWVLVDPTCKKCQTNYDINLLQLSYNVGENNKFVPYLRNLDLNTKQSTKEHNKTMDELCLNL